MKSNILIALVSVLAFACKAQSTISQLEGTWKVEGKEKYEQWSKHKSGLSGSSYKLLEGDKKITETLLISENKEETIYSATVPNQNAGATIEFKLAESSSANVLRFENSEHDFPTRIIYEFKTDDRLYIQVLGSDGRGFNFYMDRVK